MSGGYSKELFSNKIAEDLECGICLFVMREPVLTPCGHSYCLSCLQCHFQHNKKTCPLCRDDLSTYTPFRDLRTQRKILSLEVYCDNKSKGCTYASCLSDLDSHLANDCSHVTVYCPLTCKLTFYRHQMKDHLKKCPKRDVTCDYCNTKVVFERLFEHEDECPKYPLDCPNSCGEVIERSYLLSHREQCSYETIACPYAQYGCGASSSLSGQGQSFVQRVILRGELEDHLDKNVKEHLRLVTIHLKKVESVQDSKNGFIWKISNFSKFKGENLILYSNSFYTSKGGYKMCLCAYPNGFGAAENKYLSLFLCLEKGLNDESLNWPFEGDFKLSLLNQNEDEHHQLGKMVIDKDVLLLEKTSFKKPVTRNPGYGWGQFISHDQLLRPNKDVCYVSKDDVLYIRAHIAPTQSWLLP